MTTQQIDLSDMQQEALDKIIHWYKKEKKQYFFLAGYAGTGKSTLVSYVIKELGIDLERVAFACYTGKAALVLTNKANGEYKAMTVHRLIYKLDNTRKGKPEFVKKKRNELSHLKLIVIDEFSMIDGQILKDLLSFGIKVLFVGDQGQLPPISSTNNEQLMSILNNPDFALTEIHRQAKDNPIIYLSMLARTKQPIPYGKHGYNGEVLVVNKMQWNAIKDKCYTTADQIICGYNKTRHELNEDIRKYIGFNDPLPQKGDKLICIKNDWNKNIRDISLVNGMTGYVEGVNYSPNTGEEEYSLERDVMRVSFRPDFTEDKFNNLYLLKDHFLGKDFTLMPHEYGLYNEFDYGYAITCHKSQGSQWENLVVISETLNRENHHKWLYTAITRSSSKLVLVI